VEEVIEAVIEKNIIKIGKHKRKVGNYIKISGNKETCQKV